MCSRNLLLLSGSVFHGYEFLEFAKEEICSFLNEKNVKKVLFVPYALFDYDSYTEKVRKPLNSFGFEVEGIHKCDNPEKAIYSSQAIFVGGGNTFKLLKVLCDNNLIKSIHRRVFEEGVPYIGSSAGTNVATVSICTTNDMPIIYPPSFDALDLVPFNINPHYIDPDVNTTHKGETREVRIKEYHTIPGTPPVLGLREGSMLLLQDGKLTLKGFTKARLFQRCKEPMEFDVGSDLSFLL